MKITLKTLTPLWTGGVDGTSDRVHETGIIGSLRWWYETIVRGLGGWSCDPTDDGCCPDKDGRRCAACELFGCTSWQRKFKFQILNEQGSLSNIKIDPRDGLAANTVMMWQFIELRPMVDEEKWLLNQAIRIASNHGAIGGRTPRKPQGNKLVGGDYGLFEIIEYDEYVEMGKNYIKSWLSHEQYRKVNHPRWPDLRWFFFVSGECLWRKQINALTGLSEDGKSEIANGPVEKALRGKRSRGGKGGASKKIFSFETESVRRLWGYAPNADVRDQVIERLQELGIEKNNIKTGEEVLNEL